MVVKVKCQDDISRVQVAGNASDRDALRSQERILMPLFSTARINKYTYKLRRTHIFNSRFSSSHAVSSHRRGRFHASPSLYLPPPSENECHWFCVESALSVASKATKLVL